MKEYTYVTDYILFQVENLLHNIFIIIISIIIISTFTYFLTYSYKNSLYLPHYDYLLLLLHLFTQKEILKKIHIKM